MRGLRSCKESLALTNQSDDIASAVPDTVVSKIA